MPDFAHEIHYGRKQAKIICGVDEVGRGPLAGPVVAAAAIIPLGFPDSLRQEVKDSKKMSAQSREDIYEPLIQNCIYTLASASVTEIDKINILWASMLAMQRAVQALPYRVDVALIDGNRVPELECQAVALIGGDDCSLSIAAASIIAKVHRDRLMRNLAETFPSYGWERNAGYGTRQHLEALEEFGPTPWHRVSFGPVRARIDATRCSTPDDPTAA